MDENEVNDTPEFEDTADTGEVSDAGNDTPEVEGNPDGTEALQAAIKKYKVKVDGEDLDVDEEELLRGYQLSKASQKRMSEAAQLRQQAEELVKLAKTDPRKLLTHPSIGHDLKAFAEQILAEHLEEALMDPKDKELRDTKKRLAEFESAQKAIKDAEDAKQRQALYEHYETDISNKIASALDTSGLPKNESTVKRMAQYMKLAIDNGMDVQPADVVELVRNDYVNEVKSLFGSTNEDTMLSLLGDDLTNKAVKAHMKKTQKTAPKVNRVQPSQQSTGDGRATQPNQKMSRAEWKKAMEERLKGG